MELQRSKIIIDTHALIWFFEKDPKLSQKAKEIFSDPEAVLIIPVIVLCELLYILRKKKQDDFFPEIYQKLLADPRMTIPDLNSSLVSNIPESLEMHDGLIAAYCLLEKNAVILTCDLEIRAWNSEMTIW